MLEKKIITIDWKKENPSLLKEPTPLRVAAYARVSTLKEAQENSLDAQKQYFEEYIIGHDNWIFVGVYSDKGRSGLSHKKRSGFTAMLQDALNGKIDHIIVKSLSRFSRNTVDALTVIRQLKAKGVSVYFEKEGINTLDSAGEFLLTLMSSFAEEESRSISENIKWSFRHYFSQGKYTVPFSSFLGYKRGQNGELVIQAEEAAVVRFIYLLALQGRSGNHICNILMENRIPAPCGGPVWHPETVTSILYNEKYKGDALLQKTITIDFLTKAFKKNTGEAPQYYVENGHEAIIDRNTWQEIQSNWVPAKSKIPTLNPYSRKIICGCCGGSFGKRVWHSTTTHDIVWECNLKKANKAVCNNIHIYDFELQSAVEIAFSELLNSYSDIIDSCLNSCISEHNIDLARNHLSTAVHDGSFFDDFAVRFLLKEILVKEDGYIVFTFLDGTHYCYELHQKTPKGQLNYIARKKNRIKIMELHHLGYKTTKIARKLGISPNTVKSYLRRHK